MNMTNETLAIQSLKRMEGQLDDLSRVLDDDGGRSDAPAALATKAAHTIEDLITELMTEAAKKYGKQIVPDSIRVLRESVRV